ncbi:alpha/beta fold hydrolase [Salinicoccus bachuensis]|uniref:Alpha/beta fold hydrolase n=1 Tax=Salinicoccus bachuensis TaxID=3136731 RepID=A0ABZ3CMH9_9STAP
MKYKIVFIHSAGPQGRYEGSTGLIHYMKEQLGSTHEIFTPDMPLPNNPKYAEWKEVLDLHLDSMDEVILVGHSMGGSTLLKYLSEEEVETDIKALFIVAAPIWGLEEDWQKADFHLEQGFEENLGHIRHIALFHSEKDGIVPKKHFDCYHKLIKPDEQRIIESDSHLFEEGLPELVESIKNI